MQGSGAGSVSLQEGRGDFLLSVRGKAHEPGRTGLPVLGIRGRGLGRKNLRQALFQLRKLLGEEVIVLQGRNDLKLNQRVEIKTDWDMPERDFSLCQERFLDFFI